MVFRFVLIAVTALAAIALAPTASAAIEDEIIVIYKPATSVGAHVRARAQAEVVLAERKRGFGRLMLEVVESTGDVSRAQSIRRLQREPAVLLAMPNFMLEPLAPPNDPDWGSLWGLGKIDVETAWAGRTFNDVVVGVIDDGIDPNHVDLRNRLWSNPGEIPGNGLDDDGNSLIDDVIGWDFHGADGDPSHYAGLEHGTHVAGTIGAEVGNSIGIAGVAPNARIATLKVADPAGRMAFSLVLEAMDYAGYMGLDVANLSLGGEFNSGTIAQQLAYLRSIGEILEQSYPDTLYVVAAGNDTANTNTTIVWPCRITAANLICVAATTPADALAGFSNYGTDGVHIGAPGTGILSTIPGNGYDSWDGTSMAAPHVAGVASLLAGFEPTLTGSAMRQILMTTGDSRVALNGTTISGRRLNAAAAFVGFPVITTPVQVPTTSTAVAATLSATPATWAGSPTVAGAWLRDGTPISGATSSTYVTTLTDAGRELHYREIAEDGIYVRSSTSSSVWVAPANTALPVIGRDGDRVRITSLGNWVGAENASTTIRWFVDDQVVAGATEQTLGLAPSTATREIAVEVTQQTGTASTTARSASISVAPTPTATPTPTPIPTPEPPATTTREPARFSTVRAVTTTTRAARSTRRIDLRVSASQANTRATITLRVRGKLIGAAKTTLGLKRRVVRVRLNPTGRRLVQRGRLVRVVAVVTGQSGTTAAIKRTVRFTLR